MPDVGRCIFLNSLAFSGYRSFGSGIQHLASLGKINVFIGRNNSGKSNVLRIISDIYPSAASNKTVELSSLDRPLSGTHPFVIGHAPTPDTTFSGHSRWVTHLRTQFKSTLDAAQLEELSRVLEARANTLAENLPWFYYSETGELLTDGWAEAFGALSDNSLMSIWSRLTGTSGGGRDAHWIPQTLKLLTFHFSKVNTAMVPAFREISPGQNDRLDDYSGRGIIERLARLQNPEVSQTKDRELFENINKFLRQVTGSDNARIEIPHSRESITVYMDDKALPLSSLGTGIHQVIILASASTVIQNSIVCIEEPELHLNPLLQKALLSYLQEFTTNQYFLSSHSSAFMDSPDTRVFHVELEDANSVVRSASTDKDKNAVCRDLGYRPSDLLQSNCVIWVEGPSDRIYLNALLAGRHNEYVEGIHYSIMFYGGRLAAHLSGLDINDNETVDDFIALCRLNRSAIIVIDSDKRKSSDDLNNTKRRLVNEFSQGLGYAWITDGREFENYFPRSTFEMACKTIHPALQYHGKGGWFGQRLVLKSESGKTVQADKVSVARVVSRGLEFDEMPSELIGKVDDLVEFIQMANQC